MKTKKFCQFLFLATAMLLGTQDVIAQNYVRTFTFNFAPEDFEFSGEKEVDVLPGMRFYYPNEINYHFGELGTPALPYFEYPILIPDNYKMKDFTYSIVNETNINQVVDRGDTLTVDGIVLPPTPLEHSGSGPFPEVPDYPLITYPAEILHAGKFLTDGYEPEVFEINPFTYHAADRKLVLATSITLTIIIEPDNGFEIPDGRDNEAIEEIRYYVHNPEDVEKGTKNWESYLPNMIEEYKQDKTVDIKSFGEFLTCTSPTAVKLEVYSMDAVKVGEDSFHNGEASVKVIKAPATYLYIVTYPDGRRESGKVVTR